jgi:hypothetical protein
MPEAVHVMVGDEQLAVDRLADCGIEPCLG